MLLLFTKGPKVFYKTKIIIYQILMAMLIQVYLKMIMKKIFIKKYTKLKNTIQV